MAVAIRRVDLQNDMPTGRARSAAEDREVTHLRRRFSLVLEQVFSQHIRHHLCRQGMVSMEAARLHSVPEMAEASPGPLRQRRARDDGNRELETGEPQRKRRRTTRNSALAASSTKDVDEGEPNTVGPEDGASGDASFASLVETVLSVCLQV